MKTMLAVLLVLLPVIASADLVSLEITLTGNVWLHDKLLFGIHDVFELDGTGGADFDTVYDEDGTLIASSSSAGFSAFGQGVSATGGVFQTYFRGAEPPTHANARMLLTTSLWSLDWSTDWPGAVDFDGGTFHAHGDNFDFGPFLVNGERAGLTGEIVLTGGFGPEPEPEPVTSSVPEPSLFGIGLLSLAFVTQGRKP